MREVLSREEILAMPAGPELDVLVAEHVMGWKKTDRGFWSANPGDPLDIYGVGYRHDDWHDSDFDRFEPSADLAAAMLVVERYRERFLCGNLSIHFGNHFKRSVSVQICWDGPEIIANGVFASEGYLWVDADTAPLAICRAALIALLARTRRSPSS